LTEASQTSTLQLRFVGRLLIACLTVTGLFEIVALSLKNVPLQRHPMDYLITRIETHTIDADVVVMGDSVTKTVVDWHDIGPSVANLTDNRSSGVIGMKFVLTRYLARNAPPRLIYVAVTPESITYVPVDSFDFFVGSVFKSPDERSWLRKHVPEYDQRNRTTAIFDAKQRVAQPLFWAARAVSPSRPATDGLHKTDVIVELEGEEGRFVVPSALLGRLDHALVLGPAAAQAMADLCQEARGSGARLVLAWAPTPESVYEGWRRQSQLLAFQTSITTLHDRACAGIEFYDFNVDLSYPDHAFKDPEHLRRPGWTALYGRELRRQITEALAQ